MGAERRLRDLTSHLAHHAPAPATAGARPPQNAGVSAAVRLPPRQLLSDAQVRSFLADGFLMLPLGDGDDDVHSDIHRDAHRLFKANGGVGGGVGNNIYPAIAPLDRVLHSPVIDGALTSLLGPGYSTAAHRYMHNSRVGGTQALHKDSQRGKPSMHRPRSCFVFYYPAGCTEKMGCTAVLPLSHLLSADKQDWDAINGASPEQTGHAVQVNAAALGRGVEERPLTAAARRGVAVLAHHGIIHRALGRLEQESEAHPWRPMLKFIFERTVEPEAPSWDHRPGAEVLPFASLSAQPALAPAMESSWEWLLGNAAPIGPKSNFEAAWIDKQAELAAAGEPADEPDRTGAAYRLARTAWSADDSATTAACIHALLTGLTSGVEQAERASAAGLAASGPKAVAPMLQGLAKAGERGDYTRVMHLADAVGEACLSPSLAVVAALGEAAVAMERFMASDPHFLRWEAAAAAGGTERQQWELHADTARLSCWTALARLSLRATARVKNGIVLFFNRVFSVIFERAHCAWVIIVSWWPRWPRWPRWCGRVAGNRGYLNPSNAGHSIDAGDSLPRWGTGRRAAAALGCAKKG
eukprot:COSAG05_NODE_3245_length_2213_cov_2.007569_1_plen_583_part_00